MANKITKCLAGIALPLAFATCAHGQSFDGKSLDSFFSSGKTTKLTESYNNLMQEMQERSKIQESTYNFEVCPKTVHDLGKVRINYQIFKKQWNRPYFSIDSVFDSSETYNSGVFSILTATNTVHPNAEGLNKYHLENMNQSKTVKRKYDLFINHLDENGCAKMTFIFEEDRRSTFGDFLPRPSKN